jgi:hypothetical protein
MLLDFFYSVILTERMTIPGEYVEYLPSCDRTRSPDNSVSQRSLIVGRRELPCFSCLSKDACLTCINGNFEAITPY